MPIQQPAPSKSGIGSANDFGQPPMDGARRPVAGNNYIRTQDATAGTNLVSPLAATTTIVPLVVPSNAVKVTLISDGIFRFSEDVLMGQYVTVPAGIPIEVDCARMGTVYLAAATTANVSFFFSTL